jgi:hypothetical protein
LPFSGSFADASKSANPITVTGATLAPGRQGQCGNFDGDDFLQTTNNLGISGTEDWTVSFWIYRDGHQAYGAPIYATNDSFFVSTTWANPLTTHYQIWLPPWPDVRTNILLNSVWYHIVVSSKNRAYTVYANGASLGFTKNTTAASITDATVLLGKFDNGYNLKGKLDELCVFKGLAVSHSDAKRLMMGLAPIERR